MRQSQRKFLACVATGERANADAQGIVQIDDLRVIDRLNGNVFRLLPGTDRDGNGGDTKQAEPARRFDRIGRSRVTTIGEDDDTSDLT